MNSGLIIPGETYLVDMGYKGHPAFAKVIQEEHAEVFQVKILDKLVSLGYPLTLLASVNIKRKMNEAEWKKHKKKVIDFRAEVCLTPPPSKNWTSATIKSFRDYMRQ